MDNSQGDLFEKSQQIHDFTFFCPQNRRCPAKSAVTFGDDSRPENLVTVDMAIENWRRLEPSFLGKLRNRDRFFGESPDLRRS